MLVLAVALGCVPGLPLARWQWFALGVGLTQADPLAALAAVVWILALAAKAGSGGPQKRLLYNLAQLALALLMLAGLAGLLEAIHNGLLGVPRMQVLGQNSSAWTLSWFYDRTGPVLPEPGVWSVSIWWYRGLMLAWSLWLSVALLGWLRWAYNVFVEGGAWRKGPGKRPKGGEATLPTQSDGSTTGPAGGAG